MNVQTKQFLIMCGIAFFLCFSVTVIASDAMERVGLEMQEMLCH